MQCYGTKDLKSNRLHLSQFTKDDIQSSYINFLSDEKMCTYLSWSAHASLAISEKILTQWINNYQDPTFFQWAIRLKHTDQPIGSLSITQIDFTNETVELGYCIGSKYWQKGYMKEALMVVFEYLFNECFCQRIIAKTDINNLNSGYLLLSLNMAYEGIAKKSYKTKQGNYVDMLTYGITSEDYHHKAITSYQSKCEAIINNCNVILSDNYALANLSNLVSYLYEKVPYLNWVGYYFLENNELVLGPFQGKIACNPLSLNKGICAKCATSQRITIVNDVHTVKDHIACDSASNSELVLPLFSHGQLVGVLDIDSFVYNRFDALTVQLLQQVSELISQYLEKTPLAI